MREGFEKEGILILIFLVVGFVIALTEMSPLSENGGGLLLALLFWVALIQGCVAVVAACEMVKARWVVTVKRELLSVTPLLLFASIIFLLLIPFVDSYPWVGRKGLWFNKKFFVARNFFMLLATYGAARIFSKSSREGGERTKLFASLYLFAFVVCQSLVAFDWVMSLEYPWYSTLFGAYFFIESLYSGIAVAGILYIFLHGKDRGGKGGGESPYMVDLATLIFGFSLLWAGLFYAQFLVIWYGNIPEEVGFLVTRVASSPFREFSLSVVALYFFIPFLVLLGGRAKKSPYVVFAVSITILYGIFIERFIFLAPVVTMSPGSLVIDFACLLFLFVFLVMQGGHSGEKQAQSS